MRTDMDRVAGLGYEQVALRSYECLTGTNDSAGVQASQAASTLQRNVADESAAIVGFLDVYHATLTPHQAIRGKLAAWPDLIQPFCLMQHLGATTRSNILRNGNRCCVPLPSHRRASLWRATALERPMQKAPWIERLRKRLNHCNCDRLIAIDA